MNHSDAILLQRWIRQQDAEAFHEIVSRHSRMVYNTCLRVLGNPADAEDVAQECFVKLAGGVKPRSETMTGLLHTMATNQSLNRIKMDSRRRARERRFMESQPVVAEITWEDVQYYVDAALAELPEDTQSVLVAHFFEGRTHEAIAEDEGVSRSAITHRISKGVDRLRGKLAKRGIPMGAGALAGLLQAAPAEAAPPLLSVALGKLAMAGSAGTAVATGVAAWPVALKALVAAAIVVGSATPVVWHFTTPAGNAPARTPAQATETAPTDPAPADPPMQVANAAAEEDETEDNVETFTVSGTTVSTTGIPRPDVHFSRDWPYGKYRGEQSERDGTFTLEVADAPNTSWLAYSQHLQKTALVHFTRDTAASPQQVELKYGSTHVYGRILDPKGEGVGKTQVQFRFTDESGTEYLSAPVTANRYGYFGADGLPAGDGLTMEARVLPPEGEAPGPWFGKTDLRDGTVATTIPDFGVSAETADNIYRNQNLIDFRKRIFDVEPQATYGGTVQDDAGQPVAGAEVELMYDVKSGMVSTALAQTDDKGRWECVLPEEVTGLQVRIRHATCVPSTQDPDYEDPPLARMKDGTSVATVKRGQVLRGRIVNEAGKPVEDALVLGGRLYSRTPGGWRASANAIMEDATTTRTDVSGVFTLACLPPGEARLPISADGYAPQVATVDIGDGQNEATVSLSRGATIRGRVVDEAGNPLPGAYARAEQWQLDQAYSISLVALADDNGSFTLEHVPEEGQVTVDFGVVGEDGRRDRSYLGMSAQGLVPRDEPYEVMMYQPPVFKGTVVDDDTGDPIRAFHVKLGWIHDGQSQVGWLRMSGTSDIESETGEFEKEVSRVQLSYPINTAFCVGVYADGYYESVSPAYRPGEAIDPVEIRLRKGAPLTGRIVDPAGDAVADASIVWIGEGQRAFIENGMVSPRFANGPEFQAESDTDGAFTLQRSSEAGVALALCDRGYAYVNATEHEPGADITLTPWARVEGVVHTADASDENAVVRMQPLTQKDQSDLPPVYWMFNQSAHVDGRFEFDNVPAVPMEVGRYVVAARNVVLSHGTTLTPSAGENNIVNIGGEGAVVKGRFTVDDTGIADMQHVRATAVSLDVEAGENAPRYAPHVDEDGSFQINGIPAGRYRLDVSMHAPPSKNVCGSGILLGSTSTEFAVDDATDGHEVTVGDVPIELPDVPVTGSAAPDLMAFTLDGDEFTLESLRGKTVVLDFWATWCPPCRGQLPDLKALYDAIATRDDAAMVGVSFDERQDYLREYVARNNVEWTQLPMDKWNPENIVLREFGVTSIPSLWVIAPDGTVAGRDLSLEEVKALLDAA